MLKKLCLEALMKRGYSKKEIYDLLWQRSKVCGICGKDLSQEWKQYQEWRKNSRLYKRSEINLDIDHKIPKSKLSRGDWLRYICNLQLTHKICNNKKGSLKSYPQPKHLTRL
jgi:5-methylcytosine-specific restriction endonuclease McrA